MIVLWMMVMTVMGYGALPLTGPIIMPVRYQPVVELLKDLASNRERTVTQAQSRIEPFAKDLEPLLTNRYTPNVLCLSKQKAVFEAEKQRQWTLWDSDPGNELFRKAHFLMWNILIPYESSDFKNGYLNILNDIVSIFSFFEFLNHNRSGEGFLDTTIYPLHIHKLLFLMYINYFLNELSNIVLYPNVLDVDSDDRPFLEVFDAYLRKGLIKCGTDLFKHILWIENHHMQYESLNPHQEEALAILRKKGLID